MNCCNRIVFDRVVTTAQFQLFTILDFYSQRFGINPLWLFAIDATFFLCDLWAIALEVIPDLLDGCPLCAGERIKHWLDLLHCPTFTTQQALNVALVTHVGSDGQASFTVQAAIDGREINALATHLAHLEDWRKHLGEVLGCLGTHLGFFVATLVGSAYEVFPHRATVFAAIKDASNGCGFDVRRPESLEALHLATHLCGRCACLGGAAVCVCIDAGHNLIACLLVRNFASGREHVLLGASHVLDLLHSIDQVTELIDGHVFVVLAEAFVLQGQRDLWLVASVFLRLHPFHQASLCIERFQAAIVQVKARQQLIDLVGVVRAHALA